MSGPPTAEQQAAIDARDRDVLLEAGAGTGKTTVLVQRYCDAVTVDGVGLDEVLAFTFTDRAAAQLRHRIRAELRARGFDDLARQTESAWISTIHGFCQRLIGSHPVALGLDPRYRVLDEPEADRIATRAFDDALEGFMADGHAERSEIVAAFRVPRLRSLVRRAHDELRSRGSERPELPPMRDVDPLPMLGRLGAAAADALAATRDAKGSAAKTQHPKLQDAIVLAERGEVPPAAVLESIAVKSSAAAFDRPEVEAYGAAHRELLKCVVSAEHMHVYEGVRELLSLFAERYDALKEERSGLDFEDLQLEAVRLLRETRAGERYRDRFRHILVDELQDINRLQLALIEGLRGEDTVVFSVGDEFQSIYGFRHADLEVFRSQRDRLATLADAEGEVLPLSGNFRSATGVLGAVNWVGQSLLDGFHLLTPGSPEVEAGSGARTEVLLTPSAGGDDNPWRSNGEDPFGLKRPGDDPTQEHRVAEARLLAARLRRLHEDDGVPLRDVVVLMRSFVHVAAFEDELERAGLRPYVVGGRGYWSQQQVDDVRQLLGAVANPLDDLSLLGSLAAPFCGAGPDTLWLLRQAAGERLHIWPVVDRQFAEGVEPEEMAALIPEEDAVRLREFRAKLTALRADAPLLPLEALVDRAVRDFDYDLAAAGRAGGDRRLANIRKLMRLGRGYEAAEGRDLRGFIGYLADRAAGFDRPEGQAATHAEAHDGVRIMTVHAAKGLEFPVVAVADLGRRLSGRPADVLIGRDGEDDGRVGIQLARIASHGVQLFDYGELKDATAEAEAAEECRLAYVAASRAQERLILSGCFSESWDAKPLEERPISRPVIERLLETRGEAPPGIEFHENEPDPERFAELTPAAPAGNGGEPEVAPLEAAPALALPEPVARHLSYSSIATYDSCGYRFYAERVLGLARSDDIEAERGGARSFGNAVHTILERSAQEGWLAPDRPRLEAILRAEGVEDPVEVDRAEAMVAGWLGSDLCERLRSATSIRAEVPFLLPLGGTLVRGKIDLLAELEDGSRLVVDYKTNRLDGDDPAAHMEMYEEQRRIYALAATGADRQIQTAYVFLDRPDQPLIVDFAEPDLELARVELTATIARIAAGEFPVTERPHAALCHDCPAREHLCVHGPDRTLSKLPA
jgi:ATP-dependent exoDNAse (exonuclease V) beta subunit